MAEEEALNGMRRLQEMTREMEQQRTQMLASSPWPGILERLHELGLPPWARNPGELAHQLGPLRISAPSFQLDVSRFGLGGLLQTGAKLFVDHWRESERELSRLAPKAEELGRRGWTLPVRWGLTEFVHVVDEVPLEELDEAWVAYYGSDEGREFDELIQALAGQAVLDPWRRMMDGAIYTYRGGYHEAALPALFACFDGVFAAATHGPQSHAKVHTTAGEFRRKAAERAVLEVCWASIQGFVGVTHRTHPFSEEPPASVNRHWLLHGRTMPPRPQADCLRVLQALETLTLVAKD
jgi:hypothetical protein